MMPRLSSRAARVPSRSMRPMWRRGDGRDAPRIDHVRGLRSRDADQGVDRGVGRGVVWQVAVAAAVAGLALAGCSGDRVPKVASGTGSVSLALTSPVERTSTGTAKVVCVRAGRSYNVVANNVTVDGVGVTIAVHTGKYDGPGDYRVTTTLALTKGVTAAVKSGTVLDATLGDSEGTVRVDNRGGINGSVSWVCPK